MGNIILERQALVCLEEELTFGARPTTPFTNPVYVRYADVSVRANPSYIRTEIADGRRVAARKELVALGVEWSLSLEAHPKLLGWILKWGVGQQINPATGQYQYSPVEINVEQDSFTMYLDYQKSDLWGSGEDTAYMLGCKIGTLRIEGDGSGEDHRIMVTMSGIAQKVYGTTATVISGIAPLHYARTLLYSSAAPSPFMFKNHIVNWDGAGYSSGNKWKRFAIEVTNQLQPNTYGDEGSDVFVSAINTGGQSIRCEFDKQFLASTEIDDAWALTDRDLKLRVTHKDDYNVGGDNYRVLFTIPRFNLDITDPLLEASGGEGEGIVKSHAGDALTDFAVQDVTNSASGTDHTLVVATADDDLEAVKVTTSSGGFLTYFGLLMKTDGAGSTEDLVLKCYSDDGGDPDAMIAGGQANAVSAEMLTTTEQRIWFFFTSHPKLDAATDYHFVLGSTGAGSGTVIAVGDVAGTNTHTASTDGGSSWAANDADDWDYILEVDEVSMIIDYYTDGSYADAA